MKPLGHKCSPEECGWDGETCPCRPVAPVSDRQKPLTAVGGVMLPRAPTNRMLAIINSHISLLNHNPTADETYAALLAEAERGR